MTHPHTSVPSLRRTRIVCISDTHNSSPADGAFKLPAGDVLIHAGDLTNQGTLSELQKTLKWIEEADFEVKIVIAGNHDITLDKPFYEQRAQDFHNQNIQDADECARLLKSSPSIIYLHHSSATIRLRSPSGPQTTFTVFGSPYVPARGDWAFGYDTKTDHAARLWDSIPLDTDIVVTHTPPYNHCDASPKWGAAGCEALREALGRVRPRLVVCGHVHQARGAERVKWKLLPRATGAEEETEVWKDPGEGGKKMSRVDLTARGGRALENDGAVAMDGVESDVCYSDSLYPAPEEAERSTMSGLQQNRVKALAGRTGRRETCIVNAAIMSRSWGNGPKRFNKPIVVDMNLPVWDGTSKVDNEEGVIGRGRQASSRVVHFEDKEAPALVPVSAPIPGGVRHSSQAGVVVIPTGVAPVHVVSHDV